MSDKYKSLRNKLHKQKAKEKMCKSKLAFETKEDAFQNGLSIYKCKYCGKFHRTNQLNKLVTLIKKSHA